MSRQIRQIYKKLLPYETRLWLYKLRHLKDYELLRTKVHTSSKGDFSLRPFDEHQCIFIHITKTAGTSVAKSLFNYLPYHYTAIDYRVIYGRRTFNAYFKFAYVRNPWDRLYSAYRYLSAGGWNEEDKLWSENNLSQYDSFNEFVQHWITRNNIKKHRHFWPQHMFICDGKHKILVDYLAYFETVNNDFTAISQRLKINANIERHNANPGESYRDIYDKESRDIVNNIYAEDIKLFGYDFDGIRERKIINGQSNATT